VTAAKGTKWKALVDGQGPWEFAWKVPLRQKLSSRKRRRRRSASTAARPSPARNTAASGRQLLHVQLCLSCKCPVFLSITHKLNSDHNTQFKIC
jgi:hypothetical protein